MKRPPEQLVELRALIAQLREGQPTREQGMRLQQMLVESASARRTYARYGALQALLELAVAGMEAERPATIPLELPGGWLPSTVEEDQGQEPVPLAISPPFPFLSTTLPGTVGYFSSGWPVAYLIATVIFGFGLLIGSLVPVSQPEQVARQSVPLPSPLSPLPSTVGRITGMVDCQWEEGSGFGVRVRASGQWSVVSGQCPETVGIEIL